MKSILEIYSKLWEATKKDDRFIGEIFVDKVYDEVHPKLTIVDLGAFTGEFSFSCLPFAKKIYAYEPDPLPFEKLKEYVDEFDLKDIMSIFNTAVTSTEGERKMNLTHAGGSYIKEDGESTVTSTTLKKIMEDNNIDYIDILKVDIEDGEKEIFGSEEFKYLVPRIGKIIGEHDGFMKLKEYGFKVESLPHGVFLATK